MVKDCFAADARFARVAPRERGPDEWTEFETMFRGQGLPIHAAAWQSLPADDAPLAPLAIPPEDEPREGVATKRAAGTDYVFDDGHTLDYRKGARSQLSVHAEIAEDGTLAISTALVRDGYGPAKAVSFVLYDDFASVTVNGRKASPKAAKLRFAGAEQAVWTVR